MEKTAIYGGLEIRDFTKNFSEWTVIMTKKPISKSQNESLLLESKTGISWEFIKSEKGWGFGSIKMHDNLIETPLEEGLLFLRNWKNGKTIWLPGLSVQRDSETSVTFSGKIDLENVGFSYQVKVEIPEDICVAKIHYKYELDKNLSGWQVGFAYHNNFSNIWTAHLYPFAEDAKAISEDPLSYVGIPSVLMYRDDFSIALLYGLDLQFDYLNPTTWTGDCGFFFMDGVTPPQFRVGCKGLEAGINYHWPFNLVFSNAGNWVKAVPELIQRWMKVNDYETENLEIRTPDEALELFVRGRQKTLLWNPGIGYQLEEGDPNAHFVYLGEQPLNAYFEYLLYEMTGDALWRERCFEQMGFLLKGQDNDQGSVNYGMIHTAYDLGKKAFDSDDRGSNIGLKPDINAYMARYMLQTWQLVKEKEGIDRQDWYLAAVHSANWVLRQRNADGGLPQVVRYPFVYMDDGDHEKDKYYHKSASATPGRALAAFPVIYEITGDDRYLEFASELEAFVRRDVEGRLRFTGHHPDLPPDEYEEASVWGVIEYWLYKYDQTGKTDFLERAVSDAYLSVLWWCPKQLSWVQNPTQCASAEQQHFLQYSIYCYQNRKIECLWRLHEITGIPLFLALYKRVLQGIFWTQIDKGEFVGAAHERIADPWLIRNDYEDQLDFNSMGTIYIGEQILDTMLQLIEMGFAKLNPSQLLGNGNN